MQPHHTPKLCECGCGQPAPISPYTDQPHGYIKGEPRRFVQGHHNKVRQTPPLADRFWQRVNKNGPIHPVLQTPCWLWTGNTNSYGYGEMYAARSVSLMAHRFSWELHYGPIPDGLFCLHKCDVRHCVNPAHLFLGTKLDNTRDMDTKGRRVNASLKGEQVGTAKLTQEKVKEIRRRFANGEDRWSLADAFGVSISNVWMVVTMRSWRHVE